MTLPTIDQIVLTVTDDAPDEPCQGLEDCPNEAVWHLYMHSGCSCAPNPCPLCVPCQTTIAGWLTTYGPKGWECVVCLAPGSFDRFERIPR